MKRGLHQLLVFSLLAILLCATVVSADAPGIFTKLLWKITGPPANCGAEGLYSDAAKCGENCLGGECSGSTVKGMHCFYCSGGSYNTKACDSGLFTDAGSCQHECEGDCKSVFRAGDRRCFYCDGKRLTPDPTATPSNPGEPAKSCAEEGLFADESLCGENCLGGACSGVTFKGQHCFFCGVKESTIKVCDPGFFQSEGACNYACEGKCNSVWRGGTLRCWSCDGILVAPVPPPPVVLNESNGGIPPLTTPQPGTPEQPHPPSVGGGGGGGGAPGPGPEGPSTGGTDENGGGDEGGPGPSMGPTTPIGVHPPLPKAAGCPECDPIQKELNIALADLSKAEHAVADQQKKIGGLQDALDKADKALADAKSALDNFENPKSWAESGGRRLDSSDLAAIREANAAAYGRYKNGEMSAQDLQDYWGHMPEGEQEKYKQKVHEKMQKAVDDAQGKVDEAEVTLGDAKTELENLKDDVASAQKDVDALKNSYDDCIKRCHAQEEEQGGVAEGQNPPSEETWEPAAYYSQYPDEVPGAGGEQPQDTYVTQPELPKNEVFTPGQKPEKSGGVLGWLMDWYHEKFGGEQPTEEVPKTQEKPGTGTGPTFENVCEKEGFFQDKADCNCKTGESCSGFNYAQGSLGAIKCYRCVPQGACKKFAGAFGFDSNADCEKNCPAPGECLGHQMKEEAKGDLPKGYENKICYGCVKPEEGEEGGTTEGGGTETGGGITDGGGVTETPPEGPSDGPVSGKGCEGNGLMSDEFECKSCTADQVCNPVKIQDPGKPSITCFKCVAKPPTKLDCRKGGMFDTEAQCSPSCPKPGSFCHFMPSFFTKGLGCWQCVREGYRDGQSLLCPKYGLDDFNSCMTACRGKGDCVGDYLSKSAKDLDKKWSEIRCYKCVPRPSTTGGGGGVTETPPKGAVPSCETIKYQLALFTSAAACKQKCIPGTCKGANVNLKDLGKTIVCYACVPGQPTETHTTVPTGPTETYNPPTGPTETGGGTTGPVEQPCSCGYGTSTSPPDPNAILASLNQYKCVSSASINEKGTKTGNCPPCYGAPQISVNQQPPVCQTPCGPVNCGESATCSCPDKPNCQLTASCNWGGWKYAGNDQYVPVIG